MVLFCYFLLFLPLNYSLNGELQKPFFNIHNFEIDNNNSIVVGARVGVRYRFFKN